MAIKGHKKVVKPSALVQELKELIDRWREPDLVHGSGPSFLCRCNPCKFGVRWFTSKKRWVGLVLITRPVSHSSAARLSGSRINLTRVCFVFPQKCVIRSFSPLP